MKKFQNKETKITQQDEKGNKKNLTFAELANITLNITPKGGWTKDEMRKRFRLEDKLKDQEAESVIELDDADVDKLVELANIPWQFNHRDIVQYMDHLDELIKS